MKRKNLLLISTLILSAALPQSAHASMMIGGKEYWSVKEMEVASQEFDEAVENECQGDFMCKDEAYMMRYDRGGIYRAIDRFEASPFIITAVNPSQGTLRIIYYDEDKMMAHMGIPNKADITELFVARLDKGQSGSNIDRLRRTGSPYMHVAINQNESKNGSGWLQPNTEHTFVMEDPTFSDTISNSFWYYIDSENGSWLDPYDFNSCINSSDYHDGMECRIMYNSDGNAFYIPFDVENSSDAGQNTTPDNNDDPTTDVADTSGDTPDEGYGMSTDGTQNGISNTPTVAPVIIAPDTGRQTREEATASEMPWWLSTLLVSGTLLLFWWFLPNKYTKNRKKSKKVQKS